MTLAAGKFPDEPCIDGTHQDITLLGTLPYALDIVQNPFYTASAEICIGNKSCTFLYGSLVAFVNKLLAEACAATALPHYCRIDRLARILVPQHNCFALVYH